MAYLKTKILLLLLVLGLPIKGWTQSFFFTYFDPCLQEYKTITADMSAPVIVTYFGQIKAFSFEEVSRGDLDAWMQLQYTKYNNASPCLGAAVTTTTTNTTNQTITLVNQITGLVSLDFSSLVGNIGGSNINIGTTANNSTTLENNNKDENNNNTGTTGSSNQGSSGDNTGSGSNTGSNGGSGSSSSTGGGNQGGETPKEKTPEEQQLEETQKQQGQTSVKNTDKARTQVQKPAILITGDIVGIQNTNATQDARGTMSFTRVKGDGTSSFTGSVDYMLNARIGNISIMRSWINTNSKGHKGINVVSNSFTLLPGTISNTAVFVRVNSLKKFTGLYGAAATYGIMNKEPLISTLALGGVMYKGKLTKALDGTFILVGVWSPYMKYYTESVLESKPIAIPFVNLTYKLTKTFGFGLTGGGTYIVTQDILNFQILMGAKLIL
jgi:hypothetical protein